MNEQNNASCSCCTPVDISPEMATPSVVDKCPVCDQKGKKVDGATVKSMLSVSLREVQASQYFFCRTADCTIVYFNEDGQSMFDTTQVRERVYQKEPESAGVLICYCFQHTPQSIRVELLATGQSTVIDEINNGIQAGQCACDWRNPQGSCCLGNVSKFVKNIESDYHTKQNMTPSTIE